MKSLTLKKLRALRTQNDTFLNCMKNLLFKKIQI